MTDTTSNSAPLGSFFAFQEQPGVEIGSYRLIEALGEGGFGVVWKAEQTGALRRLVALKILKFGMDTRQVIARFEAERQALAMMSHPGIAAVYDAGATVSGRPYFVMELVAGAPINEYCDTRQLSTRARLQLFAEVCRAVHHAHERGVIHRDIKPSNVLVADGPQGPQPKVIDFGIAKATAARLGEQTALTEQRQILGTPDYMAPEQAAGPSVELDARADVYSLGVVLYELLSGQRPFDLASSALDDYGEMLRTIREVEPPRPSTRLATTPESAAQVATNRRTEPRELARTLRRELDWIAMKSLEKDRGRRYASALALADDLQRYLEQKPVLATPPTALYRARKFVARNRLLVASTALVIGALAAGLAVATYGLIEARREGQLAADERERARGAEREQARLRAEAELAAANAEERRREAEAARAAAVESAQIAENEARYRARVADFLGEMLKGVGPDVAQGRDTTLVRAILDRTLARLDSERGEFASDADELDDPTKFALLAVIGEVYRQLGDLPRAEAIHRRSLEIALSHGNIAAASIGEAYNNIGIALFLQTRLEEAVEALTLAAEAYDRSGVEGERARIVEPNLAAAWTQLGEYERAIESYERILAACRERRGSDPHNLAIQLSNFGVVLRGVGDAARANECFEEAFQIVNDLGETTPDLVRLMINLAASRRALGQAGSAIELLERALPLAKRIHGEEHPDVSTCMINLGSARFAHGQREEAEPLFAQALELRRKAYGEPHPELGRPYEWLAQCARARGERARACELAERAVHSLVSAHSDAHPEVLSIRAYHGRLLTEAGRVDEALPILASNYESAVHAGLATPSCELAVDAYVSALQASTRWSEAETVLVESHGTLQRLTRDGDEVAQRRVDARASKLRAFYAAWNDSEPNEHARDSEAEWASRAAR
jgi:tetratricopeptide (TPR) repeat protein